MSNRVVDLAVRITADVAGNVESTFDGVGGAAQRMGDDVEQSTTRAAGHIDKMGAASDGLDDKFGRAAGAAGALSSGADLIGNEKASVALQAMALATDFFSGVGQVGILVTEGLSAATVENEAATISQTIAQKAAAVGTKAWAIAQGALNAVMDANPIALVVLAVVALVAGVILAYKHSETFRNIVQGAMRVAAAAVHGVVNAVGDVVDWLGRVVSKFGVVGDAVHAYVFIIKTEIGLVVDVIEFVVDHVDDLGHAFGRAKDDVVSAARTIRDRAGDAFHALLNPVDSVKNAVQDLLDLIDGLIDKITHIPHPHIPDLNPLNRSATGVRGGVGGTTVEVSVDMPVVINLPVSGDPTTSAQAIVTALKELANRLGLTVADLLESGLAA